MATEYPRDLIRFIVKDGNGDPVADAYWSDVGDREIDVANPTGGGTSRYMFRGGGSLIDISPIPSALGLTVQTVSVRMSNLAPRVSDLLRGYDARLAPVTIWRGYLDPVSREFTAPARVLFHGVLDHLQYQTAERGGVGFISAEITDGMSELRRANPDVRSDASQQRRVAGDRFFRHAPTCGDWLINWGSEKKRILPWD